MKASIFAAVAIALVLPESAVGQVRASDLRLALIQLQRAVEALPPAVRPSGLMEDVAWLNRRSGSTNPADVSAEYLRSLQRAADLLDKHPSRAVIDDVASELEAKVEHCRALGVGMGGSVLLRVNTRRGAQTVNDWQVFYLLKIYERVSAASPAAFPTLSTPAETKLDPGRYWVWARDPATGRTSERTLLSVVGQKEFRVDLPVP